jgi:long-chain fatty acid transport protein
MRRALAAVVSLGVLAGFGSPRPGAAAGFSLEAQSAKASGLAGAFVAQADDPTAISYNLGGLALAPKKRKLAAGLTTLTLNQSLYQGHAPGIGAGATGEQQTGVLLPTHAYLVKPLGATGVAGLGVYSPFGFSTGWKDADGFVGRHVATRAEMSSFDVNPCLAWKLTRRIGIGAGAVYRLAEVTVVRRFEGTNPFTGEAQDFASIHAASDYQGGLGWNAGVLVKLSSVAIGASYRSPISIDLSGAGTLSAVPSGNAQLDALIAASLPLNEGLAIRSGIDFPASARLGAAVQLTSATTLEVDADWTGWSSVHELAIDFPNNPDFGRVYPLEFDDSVSFRLGLGTKLLSGLQLRVGVASEVSPQPTRTVGPLLPDSDRTVLAAGIGKDWLDVAVAWRQGSDRVVNDSVDGLNGTYRTNSWLLAVTVSK